MVFLIANIEIIELNYRVFLLNLPSKKNLQFTLVMSINIKKLTYFYNEKSLDACAKSLDACVKYLDTFTTGICRVRSLKLV
ncbi:hypothetical protein COO91_08799 [Nostoc flagelliforme CCNUN1]|uniref:Uncharacterized protein n=1 Tax=Nostoc flagelliforme CCNUN1 TaxID=2038116 RepID=A0A2K8T4Z9_9NOSO|nr:hypothetical protein COO91_08799 [Nostoc flagelliforme CCNUN1]